MTSELFSSRCSLCLEVCEFDYVIHTEVLNCSIISEPNIDSPLNMTAADLWSNQEVYKTQLHKQYKEDNKH